MRTVAVVLAFMCFGCAASIAPSGPPVSVSLLNSDFEQLKQDEKNYWEDNARTIDAFKAFQRKVEVFKASLTKQEQERFDQFWAKPSQHAALCIPDPVKVYELISASEASVLSSSGIPTHITTFRQLYHQYDDIPDHALAARVYERYFAGKLSKKKFMAIFLSPEIAIANAKFSKAIQLHNERAEFWKLANSFDEREKDLKARRASLEQQRRDNIAHLETLAALGDIQQAQEQAQMLNTLLLMTPTPAARAPLPPTFLAPTPLPPTPVLLTPPKRGVITGPAGTYYYREY